MKKPPLEKTIVNRVILTIRSRGGFAFKLHGSPLQLSGLPDVISCYRGRFVAFEVKRDETKKATPLQDYMMHRIRKAGGVALLIHSVQTAIEEMDRIDAELGGPAPRNQ